MFKMTEKISIVTDLDLRKFPFEAWPDEAKQLAYQALNRPGNLSQIQLTDPEQRREHIIQMVEAEQAHQMRFQEIMHSWLAGPWPKVGGSA